MPSHHGARASWRDQTSLQPPEVKVLPHERAPLRIRTRVLTLTRTLAPRANVQKSRRVPESAPFSFVFSEDGRNAGPSYSKHLLIKFPCQHISAAAQPSGNLNAQHQTDRSASPALEQ